VSRPTEPGAEPRDEVRLEVTDHVARVTIDRPAVLNAVDGPTHERLCEIWDRIEADPDVRVDPFLLVDAVRARGFLLQAQPAFPQPDGTVVPRSAHLTLTPVTLDVAEELVAALAAGASAVRGRPTPRPDPTLVERGAVEGLPTELAPVMATLEALPREQSPALLAQLLAAVVDPDRG